MHRTITGGLVGLALLLAPLSAHAQGVVYGDDAPISDYRPGSHQVWTATREFQEASSRKTDTFTVTTAPWRLRLTTFNYATGVDVYDADTGTMIGSTWEHRRGEHVLNFRTPGRYYLRTYGYGAWLITIEELR